MTGAWTIARREYRSFFRVPLGWIAIALYLAITGWLFGWGVVSPGEPATLRDIFGLSGFLLLPVIPAITMRLISEEIRQGTIESLMTAPVSDLAIVAGKFLGAALFLLTMLAPTLLHAATLWLVSEPRVDLGPIATGYLSLVLLGGLYLAVGLLISSLTANQTLAYLATFLLLLSLVIVGSDAIAVPEWARPITSAMALRPRLTPFTRGAIEWAHVIYFVSATAWLLILAYVALGSRRWR